MCPQSASGRQQRYELRDPLGAGGQGRTYRALDTVTDRTVAVKVIRLADAGWKSFDLFERECRVLRSLDHPAIPKYLDTFAVEEEGRYFLVMELVEGTPLRELIDKSAPLSEAQIWNLLHQALAVLEYLHALHPPVIHRDIKPANLIRRPDGRLSLVDFGGVRVALQPDGGSTVIGSFGYMAPEQLHGEATPASDLFSLGATLAALAVGMEADKLPRRGLKVDLPEVMSASPLRELLARLLEPDPTLRPASVAAVRDLIRDRPGGHEERTIQLEDDGSEQPPRGADLLLRVFGTLGYVGLVLVEAMLLPIVYFLLGQAWSKHPDRIRRLEARRELAKGALRRGRRSMRQLARGEQRWRGSLPPAPPRPPSLPEGHRRRRRRG